MARTEQYYALCREAEREIAYLDLGKEEGLGQLLGIAVYTLPDGEAQRKHLEEYTGTNLTIAPVTHEELLAAVNRAMPVSIFTTATRSPAA